jgi:23S rRNA (pseudouridine1915-N3)-methyltransferase
VRIGLICVGKLRPPFADDVAHYQRLLRPLARVETVELQEGRGDPPRAMAAEADAVLKRVPEQAFLCVLERGGEALSSEELAAWIEERRHEGRQLWFGIGGPFGFAAAGRARADRRLSLGPATLPHQLARVVLLEQLFRAHKIIKGEPYHY